MKKYTEEVLKAAHRHSIWHREEVLASEICGCFYCRRVCLPAYIEEWTDGGWTAFCPYCYMDSIIGDKSGYSVGDPDFLKEMNEYWF